MNLYLNLSRQNSFENMRWCFSAVFCLQRDKNFGRAKTNSESFTRENPSLRRAR